MMFTQKEYRESGMLDVMKEVHSLLVRIKTNEAWSITESEALDKKVVKVLESYGKIVEDN